MHGNEMKLFKEEEIKEEKCLLWKQKRRNEKLKKKRRELSCTEVKQNYSRKMKEK